MRVDEAEKDKADAGLDLARTKFDPFPKAMGEYERNDYWASVTIPYKPYYNFEETLAAFGDAPGLRLPCSAPTSDSPPRSPRARSVRSGR